ncbi:uncharacterized protein BT62DRAFT_709249 [Guyanagaster necrorhizus]|uniref:Uncharacterized protein n=1 Tax=Guyanagaster necrorhizus TaxID=856835 RepID=A0A9P7VXY0_9AGAR|nr:uncharacterized protein BT62DRAFT_709249 [Guyanagaster necrorhizus MCA 3950]KAG7448500.1 hypothetical protein BT62DRAFT_709249 [Guyanagaster necrorhizus MCA 3950]
MTDLTPHQRTRLLRSTRKLGALLGTTPQCQSVNTHNSNLSLSLAPGTGPALVLRIHTTATTTALPNVHYPLSPVSPVLDRKPDDRRKRMAKLARTFGENVPPELVSSVPARRPRRRSCSIDTILSPLPKPVPLPSFHEESEDSPLLPCKFSRSASVRATSKSPVLIKHDVRSQSVDEGERRHFQDRSHFWGRRKEKAWSGEWNRRDREDVLMHLRALKASL